MSILSRAKSLVFGLTLTALVACGGGGGGGADNQAACEGYVNTVNELPCLSGAAMLNPSSACPDALVSTRCDLSEYYDCLSAGYMCMDLGGGSSIPVAPSTCTVPSG